MNVYEFLDQNLVRQVVTVKRTEKTRFWTTLIARNTAKAKKAKLKFFQYEKTKGFLEGLKGALEEHPLEIFATGQKYVYVLEGFPKAWVVGLNLPNDTFVIADTDGGELEYEPWGWRYRRVLLKVLVRLLDTEFKTRDILGLDWGGFRDAEDYEPFLAKAKILGWSPEDMSKELSYKSSGNILTLTKRADHQPLVAMLNRFGPIWLHEHFVEALSEVVNYKYLRAMGFDQDRVAKEMEVEGWRKEALEEASQMLTYEDLSVMASHLLKLDGMVFRHRLAGVQILLFNMPNRLRR